jgi:type IV pilus assembly protein PilB
VNLRVAVEKRKLGNILVSAGKITEDQLQEALKTQRIIGKKLGEILVEGKVLDEDQIIEAIEEQTGIRKIDLNNVTFDRKAISLIPQNLCSKYTLIPFGFDDNRIKVALSDPLNIFAIDDVTIATGFEIKNYIARKADIKKFIEIYYTSIQVANAAEQLSKESQENKTIKLNVEDLDDVKNAPVVKMVEYLFKNSIEMKASDIHIEPFENEIRIRYRIDGRLQTVNTLGIDSQGSLVTRIKILAGLNIAEKRIPQDGRIMLNYGESQHIDLRVSILPVVNGEKIVIRILNTSSNTINKEKLGMTKENLERLDRIISNPHGIILVTGPTGSGKSTSLYAVLNQLNKTDVNIITIEDPVEYTLNGVNQVNVNIKAGLTFASGLRSILRQDPDIVMVGEIRDEETAEIATKAAITGHLVLSTLHTNDAPSSIVRLIDMGVQPYLVATSVVGIMAQRLVRRICPHCRKEYEADKYEKEILEYNVQEPLTLHNGKGCGYCNGTAIWEELEYMKLWKLQENIEMQ